MVSRVRVSDWVMVRVRSSLLGLWSVVAAAFWLVGMAIPHLQEDRLIVKRERKVESKGGKDGGREG